MTRRPRALAVSRPAPLPSIAITIASLVALAALIAIAFAPAHAEEKAGAAKSPAPIEPAEKSVKGFIPHEVDSFLIQDLREGGYVIFFRHAVTNWQQRDVTEGDFQNREHQRNLTEAGLAEAAMIGQSLRVLQIPIEKVLSSPMWRCRDTAQFAFDTYDTTGNLFWKGPKFREARIAMLSTPPAKGKNLILIGHQDQFIPIVPGLKRDLLGEGDALIIKPKGEGKFKVVTMVTPMEWANLAGVSPIDIDGQQYYFGDSTKGNTVQQKKGSRGSE
jgi:phosphohistidine phosphatase SixA